MSSDQVRLILVLVIPGDVLGAGPWCYAGDEASDQGVHDLVTEGPPSEFLVSDALADQEDEGSQQLRRNAEEHRMVSQRHRENHVPQETEEEAEGECESARGESALFVALEELSQSEGR